ncbi:MAG TPA: hypothetical protein VHZ78_04785 [Rhizomicrobium sp.]|jgi:hypothetical protein|nr:hypothetical protein [Rhizomicrobium sp.]
MTMQIPAALRDRPWESFVAGALLLSLLFAGSDGAAQKAQSNQTLSACRTANCVAKSSG